MDATSTETQAPFWEDDPFPYHGASVKDLTLIQNIALGAVSCFRIVELLVLIAILALFAQKHLVVWILIAVLVCVFPGMTIGLRLALRRKGVDARARAMRAQELAQERTGAELMGSAIHTAGHPLLQKNQPVVLGLRGDELSIYGYSNSQPIDVISVRDIRGVHIITLDEELIAHTDVVDSTAQAFQLSMSARGTAYTCSFRRMYRVRAIEWYRALEARRLAAGGE